MSRFLPTFTITMFLFFIIEDFVFASSSTTVDVLPWDDSLTVLKQSITGPIAGGISLIGVVVAGGGLIFGGELNEFARRGVMLALVICLMVSAASVLEGIFAGAII